jgi:hypothetical protein
MHSYVKIEGKDEELKAEKTMKKIKILEKKIHKELDDQKLT